jgi:hypothetical protein
MAYKLYKDVLYPGWEQYHGEADVCYSHFHTGPEQADWLGQSYIRNKLISSCKSEVEKQGGTILRLTVWRDIAPTWETDYQVIITAHGSPGVLVWVAIIAGIALLMALFALAIIMVIKVDWNKLVEDIAKGLKWTTYAIIGGGVLACGLALIITRAPPKGG